MNKLTYIKSFIKRKRKIKKAVKQLKNYLKSGSYVYSINAYYLVINNVEEKNKAQKLLLEKTQSNQSKIIQLTKKLLSSGRVRIKSKGNYNATLILLTNQDKSLKMFDFKNLVVINKFFCQKDYASMFENYNYFSNYFNVPKIIEEYLEYNKTHEISLSLKNELVREIFLRYVKYVESQSSFKEVTIVEKIIESNSKVIFKDEFLKTKIPVVKNMGDLMYKNIMYYNKEFYFIDFELSSYNFVLYDIFTFIFFSYYNYDEKMYYNKYMDGTYDVYISKIFSHYDLDFIEDFRLDYFKLFIYERIKEESKYRGNYNDHHIVFKFNELIKNKEGKDV